MGTRSRIGVMHGDVVKSVYCHWDGYLEHNGKILQQHYDSAKANNLVALGDISSLRPEIGVAHPFSVWENNDPNKSKTMTQTEFDQLYGNMTTFYGRDRDEQDCSWKVSHSFAEFLQEVEYCGAEYYYIIKDGVWYCGTVHRGTDMTGILVPLAEALANELDQEAV